MESEKRQRPTDLNEWFQTTLGRSLLEVESDSLQKMLPGLYGPVAVQFGEEELLTFMRYTDSAVRISSLYPGRGASDVEPISPTVRCQPEAMPFEHKSIGLCMLAHVLEFSRDPHLVLREVDRVLVAEGHVVIVGFNPWSWWGLHSLFRSTFPFNGRFTALSRLKDWLALLNFEIVSGRMIYQRPPVQSKKLLDRLRFMEAAGNRWWPLTAGVYVLVARKREIGMTAILPKWKKKPRITGLAEPVVRIGASQRRAYKVAGPD